MMNFYCMECKRMTDDGCSQCNIYKEVNEDILEEDEEDYDGEIQDNDNH